MFKFDIGTYRFIVNSPNLSTSPLSPPITALEFREFRWFYLPTVNSQRLGLSRAGPSGVNLKAFYWKGGPASLFFPDRCELEAKWPVRCWKPSSDHKSNQPQDKVVQFREERQKEIKSLGSVLNQWIKHFLKPSHLLNRKS